MSLKAPKTSPVTGVILAGGKSRRMGENKALLQLGGDSLIGHVIHRMRLVTDELLLITNNPTEYKHLDLPMYEDILPNTGALGGIHTGLSYASHDAVLCVACDSPFLDPKLITYLTSLLGGHDAVIPYTFRGDTGQMTLQTLCAVYSKRCLPIIKRMLQEREFRVHAIYERAHIKRIPPEVWRKFDPEGMSFFNINTPEDFDRATTSMRSQTQQ
ncbi:molybdenum cofactor guanylyltransferase [Candidatus Poribacteria bacterium]|nr:MAG: molybdenum cofactor guanylyltransferase [Candidatus Poribacteria bacterium]